VIVEGYQQRRTSRRKLQPAYWLIEKIEDDSMEVLTVDVQGGQQALSIFSHREEAEMFLWLERLTDSWRARRSEGREIARVLSDSRARIGFVVLDPLPEMVAEKTGSLVSLPQEHFTDRFASRGFIHDDYPETPKLCPS
jgi:hypothetical protein